MKLRQWHVGLALVVAALLAWAFTSIRSFEPARARSPAEIASTPTVAGEHETAREGPLQLVSEQRRSPEPTDAEENRFPCWVSVSGRLSLPRGTPRSPVLRLHIDGEDDFAWDIETTGGAVDALGSFAVGSRYRGEGPPRGASLHVYIDDLGFTRTPKLRPEEFTFDEDSRTWQAKVSIDLNWIVVRGRLVDDLGQPVSACRVVLKRLSSDGKEVECITARDTGGDGRFELDSVACGETLELSIQLQGFVPIHRGVALADGLVQDLGVLQLSRGLSISGHLKSSFPPQARVRQLEVWLTHPAQDERDPQTGAVRTSTTTERVAEVPIAEDGSFKLTGLTPDEYTIRLRGKRELLGGRSKRKALLVAAPASDLVLVDDGAIVRMQARDRATGKAIPGHLRVKFNGRWCWPTDGWPVSDDDGPLNLNWDCGVAVEGLARMNGYRDTPVSFTTPGEGEVLEYDVLFDALPPEVEKR